MIPRGGPARPGDQTGGAAAARWHIIRPIRENYMPSPILPVTKESSGTGLGAI